MARTLNVEDVKDAIDEFGIVEFVEILQESDWNPKHTEKDTVTLPNIGVATLVEGDFGTEGGGDSAWVVFSINNELFQINGYYSSYDGTTWDGPYVEAVKSKEITKIIYVADKD